MSQKLSRYSEFTTEELEEIFQGLTGSHFNDWAMDPKTNRKLADELFPIVMKRKAVEVL